MMADEIRPSALWERDRVRVKMLFWILLSVSSSPVFPVQSQSPLPLSLPTRLWVDPPAWRFLPLSQVELGLLFSNSSPFSSAHSLLLLPPPGRGPTPGLQASFGPYSVTQLISEPILPLSSPLVASLLSSGVERELVGGEERYKLSVVFHLRGGGTPWGSCVTLHAFRETQEHAATCLTQSPLGLCTVTLVLPGDWFGADLPGRSSFLGSDKRLRQPFHRGQRREQHRWNRRQGSAGDDDSGNVRTRHSSVRTRPGMEGRVLGPGALRDQRAPKRIQLYYSSFSTPENHLTPPNCMEDRLDRRQLFFMRSVELREEEKKREANRTKEVEDCLNGQEEEELFLDPHVLIRYHKGPVRIGQTIGVSVNLRANISSETVIIRLKVKRGLVSMVARRTLTSEVWAVTLERSQGAKHDVVSIICHTHTRASHTLDSSLLQHVVCLSVDGLRRSFGVAMTVSADWRVEYSGRSSHPWPPGVAVSRFSFSDRHIVGIAPITESDTIINTAILTSEPVSLPVIVLAVENNGKMSDVTAAATCQSSNENIVKVSSDCSMLFVDGSESGVGSTCVGVEFGLGVLSGSVCVSVWAPTVPLRVSLADPVLNAIDGWKHFTEHGCSEVFQRSTVQVLAQFTAQNSQSKITHLLGSSDWFVDVSELVGDWLRVEDPRVASLDKHNVIGLRPGNTLLQVISGQWDGVLGSCDIIVTSDPVTMGDLSVQVVSGLGMSITASPAHPSVVTVTVSSNNILYNQEQEASLSVWLQFSDDAASLLSSFAGLPYFLRVSSLAETVVAITPGPAQHIVARGEGGGPLLRAELLVSTCIDQPVTSSSLSKSNHEGAGTRRLAKGSGWIRVHLDTDLIQSIGKEVEEGEEFEFDISDTLVEPEADVYSTNFDDDLSANLTAAGVVYDRTGSRPDRTGNIMTRNNLERAVLIPSHEESGVYFSPSQEEGEELPEEEEEEEEEGEAKRERVGERELEVGLGAILSLLCLSTVLFLANCLPCALRERGHRSKTSGQEEKRDGEMEGGTQRGEWEGGDEEGKKGFEEKEEMKGEEVKIEDVTEVEIIC